MTTPSVLIIDDDEAAREAVAQDLRREGYDLYFAENGEEGFSIMRQITPSVIVLDLRMPVMDGIGFLDKLDLRPRDPYSVIVLTGHGHGKAIRECYNLGVSIFLKKPFNLYEIRGIVKNTIAVKQLSKDLDDQVQQRTSELEQRLTEISALNRLSQEQINRGGEQDADLGDAAKELRRVAQEAGDLAQRIDSNITPPGVPGLG